MNAEFIQKHYKSFRHTVAFCVIGLLAISAISYYVANQMLLKNRDHALENAVFAIQEIIVDDHAAARVLSGSTNAPAYLSYKEKLSRFLSQSREISIAGVALYKSGNEVIFLAAETNAPGYMLAENLRAALEALPAEEQQQPRKEPASGTQPGIFHLDFSTAGKMHAAVSFVHMESGNTLIYYAGQPAEAFQSRQYAYLLLESAHALFSIIAIVLSIVFYTEATKAKHEGLNARNKELQEELHLLQAKEKKLRDIIRDNERFNTLTLRREERVIQLKAEVNQLLAQMQREKRYNVDKMD